MSSQSALAVFSSESDSVTSASTMSAAVAMTASQTPSHQSGVNGSSENGGGAQGGGGAVVSPSSSQFQRLKVWYNIGGIKISLKALLYNPMKLYFKTISHGL